MMKSIHAGLLAGLSCLALASAAEAATSTATLGVSVTIAATCAASASTMNFGSIASGPADVDSTGTITVTCTKNAAFNVGLNAGQGSTLVTARKMKNTSTTDLLNYSLYRDAARTLNWGSTVGTDTLAGTGTGAAQSIPVYGRIPGGQVVPAGSYGDTISLVVTY